MNHEATKNAIPKKIKKKKRRSAADTQVNAAQQKAQNAFAAYQLDSRAENHAKL